MRIAAPRGVSTDADYWRAFISPGYRDAKSCRTMCKILLVHFCLQIPYKKGFAHAADPHAEMEEIERNLEIE